MIHHEKPTSIFCLHINNGPSGWTMRIKRIPRRAQSSCVLQSDSSSIHLHPFLHNTSCINNALWYPSNKTLKYLHIYIYSIFHPLSSNLEKNIRTWSHQANGSTTPGWKQSHTVLKEGNNILKRTYVRPSGPSWSMLKWEIFCTWGLTCTMSETTKKTYFSEQQGMRPMFAV